MTQSALAEPLRLTYQQVQKYETGRNRISASTLWEIARALDVAPDFFFQGASLALASDGGQPRADELLRSREGVALLRALPRLMPAHRRAVITFIDALIKGA